MVSIGVNIRVDEIYRVWGRGGFVRMGIIGIDIDGISECRDLWMVVRGLWFDVN